MSRARPALRVDRVRLENARAGDRARLASALAMASPAATGVADRALLLVRRVRVDRPLAAGTEGFAGELIDRIRAAKTRARRGAIGAGESLYFEDEAALERAIVCAVLDGAKLPELVRRAIPDCEAPQLRWRRRILSDARTLPGLMMALVEAGIAGAWLARFDEAELRTAAELLLRSYGSTARLPERVPGERPDSVSAARVPGPKSVPAAAIVEAIALARSATPAHAAGLLIAIATLAVRRPELVATQALADALTAAFDPSASPVVSGNAIRGTPMVPAAARVAPASTPPAPGKPRAVAQRAAMREQQSSSRPTTMADAQQSAARRAVTIGSRTRESAAQLPPAAMPIAGASTSVRSDCAGLFFLLNAFLALGLYGDFTDPARRVRGLSPFELLLLLGRRWIGAEFARDPLEPVLRGLAGLGPRERVGRNFEAPAWQVPADWLAPWPGAAQRRVRSRAGVSRWHAAGFPIADQWHAARPAVWLRRRWVDSLARYVEARLARALGSTDSAEAVETLLRRPGTVRLDDGQIEVAFALDTHPLAIRLAGLDRDPGWIPAAGRAIGFRFA